MRASCCVSVLPPSSRPPRRMSRTTARADADRIDARVVIEAAILDRDDRVLQIGRDLVERARRAAARRGGTTAGRRRRRTRCRRRRASADGRRRRSATATRPETAPPTTQREHERQRDPVRDAARPQQVQRRLLVRRAAARRPRRMRRLRAAPARRAYTSAAPKITTIRPSDSHLRNLERRCSPRCAGTRSAA